MKIGYARTSTTDQLAGFEAQLRELQGAGCDKVFQEQVSSIGQRDQLALAIEFAREGDIFVVTKLDRLARSTANLLEIAHKLEQKRVALHILNMGMDTSTPTGKMLLTMLGAIAQFEREIMLERQREGIAKAKGQGKYRGRKPISEEICLEIRQMAAARITRKKIAEKFNLGEASVYRVLKKKAAV